MMLLEKSRPHPPNLEVANATVRINWHGNKSETERSKLPSPMAVATRDTSRYMRIRSMELTIRYSYSTIPIFTLA